MTEKYLGDGSNSKGQEDKIQLKATKSMKKINATHSSAGCVYLRKACVVNHTLCNPRVFRLP